MKNEDRVIYACYMGHFGRRARWRHSFLKLTQEEVKFVPNYVKLRNLKKKIPKHTCLVQFCLWFQTYQLLWYRAIANTTNCVTKFDVNGIPITMFFVHWKVKKKITILHGDIGAGCFCWCRYSPKSNISFLHNFGCYSHLLRAGAVVPACLFENNGGKLAWAL